MKTIIINGSPKGNTKNCNSRIISEVFVQSMKVPCETRCIADSNPEELAGYLEEFDAVIFVLPLYIHAMPGIMMNFIEHMKPTKAKEKSLGFIIQAGFVETAQQKYVERYFESLAKQLNYQYLGTVMKGEAAAIYMLPKMFGKVLRRFNELGKIYEKTGKFDQEIVTALRKPYELTKFQARLFQLCCDLGLNNIAWHSRLKKNNAFDKRLDRPFL